MCGQNFPCNGKNVEVRVITRRHQVRPVGTALCWLLKLQAPVAKLHFFCAMASLDESVSLLSQWLEENDIGVENDKSKRRRCGQAEVRTAEYTNGTLLAICAAGTIQADSIFSLAFAPFGLSEFKTFRVDFDASTWISRPPIMNVCCSQWAGLLLVTVEVTGTIRLWSIATGDQLMQHQTDFPVNDTTALAVNDAWVMLGTHGHGLFGVNWRDYCAVDTTMFQMTNEVAKTVRCLAFDDGDAHHLWVGTDTSPRLLDVSVQIENLCLMNPMVHSAFPWGTNMRDFFLSLHVHHALEHKFAAGCNLCERARESMERLNTTLGEGTPVFNVQSFEDQRVVVTGSTVYYADTTEGMVERIPVKPCGVAATRACDAGVWIVWRDNTVDFVSLGGKSVQYFEFPENCAVDWESVRNPGAQIAVCFDGLRVVAGKQTVVLFSL